MRFKLYNLNCIHKSCISKYSSQTHRTLYQNHVIQTLTAPYLNGHDRFVIPENPNYKISKRWHLGHSHKPHDHQHNPSSKEGEKIFRLGLAADIGLATGKALTGYLTGSTAIIADAAHSVSDVVLSGVALLSFKVASAPKDKDHPYGHFDCLYLFPLFVDSVQVVAYYAISCQKLFNIQFNVSLICFN